MRKVHGVSASPFVRKVLVSLEEKGLEYEQVPVFPFGVSEEFLTISPLGKIPVYEEDGWTVPDSSIILNYLESTTSSAPLYPADARLKAEALFLEEWSDTALMPAIGDVFFQRIVGPAFMKQETKLDVVEAALTEKIPPLFDFLESRLADGREFLIGDALSVADVSVASCLVNFAHAGEKPDPAKWPKLAAFANHMHARPSFAKLIAEEQALFGG